MNECWEANDGNGCGKECKRCKRWGSGERENVVVMNNG